MNIFQELYPLHIEKFGKVFGHEERMLLQQIEGTEEKPNDGWKKATVMRLA